MRSGKFAGRQAVVLAGKGLGTEEVGAREWCLNPKGEGLPQFTPTTEPEDP